MALMVMLLSGLLGVVASITALVGFDASWFQALVIYLVSSIVPAALVMVGCYLHLQITRALAPSASSARAQSTR